MTALQTIVSALTIYPVKSCAGISLQHARLTATGLEHDRRWMLVKPDGYFITQRELPRLALIQPVLHMQGLILSAPGMPDITIPGTAQTSIEVVVWRDSCLAFDEGDAAAIWCSNFLQQPVRLVRFDDARERLSNREYTGAVQAPNHFTDGYPILLIATASLDDLNSRLTQALPMNRFRPNVVITGVAPYMEDTMDELSDGLLSLRVVKPCIRCKITTTNHLSGEVEGDEPLLTLVRYRRNLELKGVMFGQNVIIASGVGSTLSVGQTLTYTLR